MIEFTWIDAFMIIFIFIFIGLITGKKQYDAKLEKEKHDANKIEKE